MIFNPKREKKNFFWDVSFQGKKRLHFFKSSRRLSFGKLKIFRNLFIEARLF